MWMVDECNFQFITPINLPLSQNEQFGGLFEYNCKEGGVLFD